jgi:hypothetical protein
MTPTQYREAIARLGLSQAAAGRFLTGRERTSRSWASGESRIPKSVEMLLLLMIDMELDPKDIETYATPGGDSNETDT